MANTSKPCRVLKCVSGVAATLALLAIAANLLFGLGDGGESGSTATLNFPAGGPVEFLYLDSSRVAAYLAQFNGGSFTNEKESRKLTDTLKGGLNVDGIEAGGSKAQEDFVEREITPTAANQFLALSTAMESQGEVHHIHLSKFATEVHRLPEGQFVYFRTSALLSPTYLSAYMASRRPHGVRDLFPPDGQNGAAPRITAERRAAWKFKYELGKDPRAVFSLHTGKAGHGKRFTYLLPMSAELLTEEESLLARGGGKFTVVGKLVRSFPEEGDRQVPAYVDSATLQTWDGALRTAPGELICRTDPRCEGRVRELHLRGTGRLKSIQSARRRELRALDEQTEIEKHGAVIIPIAIYK
jgi:hypothetical protein